MKKSKSVSLVLITAVLAGCASQESPKEWSAGQNETYLRSDTSAPYSRAYHYHGGGLGTALLWYYAFRPYGGYGNGMGYRQGYYSDAISRRSNVGSNLAKAGIVRGGFGRHASSART